MALRRRIESDRMGVAGFQESLVAALIITIATMVLLVGLGRAIGSGSAKTIEERRTGEVEKLLSSVRSSVAFEDGIMDLSRIGAIANLTERAAGTFDGVRVTLDLVMDDNSEIELGRRGSMLENVSQVEMVWAVVEVRTPSSQVTAGVLWVSAWWD